jgi:NRPS condensation-like uncharacterized protein
VKRAFTRLEEAVYHVERMYTPWNIQIEIETRERIDRDRLQAAVRNAYDVHPIAKAHKRRGGEGATDYDWLVPEEASVPLEVADGSDDLDALRQRFYGDGIDLSTSPPLRLLVVRNGGDAGDLLWFCSSHIPMDGMGAYRILQAICTAYRGEEPDPGRFEFGESRDILDGLRPDSRRQRARLLGKPIGRLDYLLDPPSRLAGAEDPAIVGWRYRHRQLGEDSVGALLNDATDASVNDQLLAAMHLTIDRWNREAGAAAETLSVMMPVNLRPREWFHEGVGLYTLFESVTTDPADRRSAAQAVARVTDQTRRIKAERPYLGYLEWLNLVPEAVPLSLKKRLPKLLDGPGERLLDTAVLSNLGRLPEPLPALSEGAPESLWCTPPCWLPTPVSIGVVTVGEEIHLGFRYAQSAFDGEEADAFADRYCERVADVV